MLVKVITVLVASVTLAIACGDYSLGCMSSPFGSEFCRLECEKVANNVNCGLEATRCG